VEENKDMVKTSVAALGEQKEWVDPWADVGENDEAMVVEIEQNNETLQLSFIDKEKARVAPATLKRQPVSLAASNAKIPAVRLPDAGISYNPEFDKWDILLSREGEKEVVAEKKRLAEAAHEAYIRELADKEDKEPIESSDSESESEDEGDGSNNATSLSSFIKKRPERKTQAQRNKIKRRKDAEREVQRLAHIRKQKAQLETLKSMAKAIAEKDKKRMEMVAGSNGQVNSDVETLRKRKFGKHAYVPPFCSSLPTQPQRYLHLCQVVLYRLHRMSFEY